MFPKPCELAIPIMNSLPPREWPNAFPVDLRRQILREKTDVMKSLSGEDLRLYRNLARRSAEAPKETRPFPKIPAFVKLQRNVQPVKTLQYLFPEYQNQLGSRIEAHRFGCDWRSEGWVILAPKEEPTLAYLASLAHELGHILVNRGPKQTLCEMIISEATAYILEEILVQHWMTGVERQEWQVYCREIDRYNHYFFKAEWEGHVDEFLNSKLIWRESLWTSHGYQGVYAAASQLRQLWLEK